MKILVAVKRVVDFNVKIRVARDQSRVETDNVKMAINPFDEIALEQAIRIKEAGQADSIRVVSVGSDAAQDILRQALALGADEALLVRTDKQLPPLSIAKILHHVINKETPGLVLMGKQAIDGDHNQTGQMLAALLGWAQGTFASAITLDNDTAWVTREIDGGLERLALKLPAVITSDLRLNTPRYASLPNIMRAKSKPLRIIALDTLDLPLKTHLKTGKITPPPARKAGIMVSDIAELIECLKKEKAI